MVYCDSQSAIYLARYQVHHPRTKYIDEWYHLVIEVIAEDEIRLKNVATEDNPADMLTKMVNSAMFEHCLDLVQMKQVWSCKYSGAMEAVILDASIWILCQGGNCWIWH